MNLTEKIKNSWWVILSFIIFLNGLGFMYIGFKHNNRNWILEGITYEFPWFFYLSPLVVFILSLPPYISLGAEPKSNRNLCLDMGAGDGRGRTVGVSSNFKCSWKCCQKAWDHGISPGLFQWV